MVGPDGQPVAVPAEAVEQADGDEDGDDLRELTDLVEQPAKVMRIGSMIRQLLEEVKSAPLDDASRNRLKEIHRSSIKELESGLAPELVEELERLSLPFTEDATPSDAELRIAQAQLVGWLEGLFHGIQTAIYAQQVSARAQFEQMRRALPGRPGTGRLAGRHASSARDAADTGRRPGGGRRGGHAERDVSLAVPGSGLGSMSACSVRGSRPSSRATSVSRLPAAAGSSARRTSNASSTGMSSVRATAPFACSMTTRLLRANCSCSVSSSARRRARSCIRPIVAMSDRARATRRSS